MKQDRFLDALSNIDTDIVEEFVCMDNQLRHQRQNKKKTPLCEYCTHSQRCF